MDVGKSLLLLVMTGDRKTKTQVSNGARFKA